MIQPGTATTYKGQRYECTGLVPHVDKRGHLIELPLWESICPDCGARFQIQTGRRGLPKHGPTRRCPGCRKPGKRVERNPD